MDLTTLWHVVLLGIIEGLTEFLPVSSTGHLMLAGRLLGVDLEAPHMLVFNIVIQFGAILAVCWVYRQRLREATLGVFGKPEEQRFVRNVGLAVVPALVLGALLHDRIEALLERPMVVAVTLILGGLAILAIERMAKTERFDRIEAFPVWLSLAIGVMQCLAMVPGVSRSGATIMGALLMGVSRRAAAEFTFFLAVPTMAAASAYQLLKHHDALDLSQVGMIAIGFVVSYVCALVVVKGFVGFVSRFGFGAFAWYRIALGALALLLLR